MRVRVLLAAAAALLFAASAFADPAYAYDPWNRRDPFDQGDPGCNPNGEPRCDGLACVNAETLKLTALLVGTATPRALIEDANGRGHSVRIGDVVAHRRVVAITRDGLTLRGRIAITRTLVRDDTVVLTLRRPV